MAETSRTGVEYPLSSPEYSPMDDKKENMEETTSDGLKDGNGNNSIHDKNREPLKKNTFYPRMCCFRNITAILFSKFIQPLQTV